MSEPEAGRVVPLPAAPFWSVAGFDDDILSSIRQFLEDFWARGASQASIKSYCQDLVRWQRFLLRNETDWRRVDTAVVRNFVLELRSAIKPGSRGNRRVLGINVQTGKPTLPETYAPRTINHNLSVVSEFYEFHLRSLLGPLRNPVPKREGQGGLRYGAHTNPMDPYPNTRRASFRQKEPRVGPRSIPVNREQDLFACLTNNRDRALVSFYVSSGVRPAELLGLTNSLINPGEQTITVRRKGSGALQRVPASPEAFVWYRLYQESLPPDLAAPESAAWWTLRKPYRTLNYEAARAVLRRINAQLATNWTLHDFRHTAASRWADDRMTITDISRLLGHQSVETTQVYLATRDSEVIDRALAHMKGAAARAKVKQISPAGSLSYSEADLHELFGGDEW